MINLEWVREYIDINDQDLKELAVKVTKAGINVESVITNHISNLIIGQITHVADHPDSDHLHVCKVDIGSQIKQIVCGASNVREGMKVIVALEGAVLQDDFTIKKSKIRNVESEGMLCALFELGLEEKTEETYHKGIHELGKDAKVGEDPIRYLGLDDTLYELDVHKHRNNDCYYHIGFAYELAAILNRKVTLPEDLFDEIDEKVDSHIHLDIETDKCPYYLAKMVTDIEIGPSPQFIQKRLKSVGIRSINNVVDISNYVMLEYGQPLHFFDKDKLGDHILVRDAKEGENIITLDGKERKLTKEDIVITDGKNPVCVAGVMGGANTEVDEHTKTILIESAIFAPTSIRYTASRLGLKSEASIRYGKGLSYEYTEKAMKRACYLLKKYANAKVLTGIIRYDKIDKTQKIVEFTPQEINKMLGITICEEDMEVELERLDFPYKRNGDKFIVTIPPRRLDIEPYINDIAEEIARLYGYHNLISTLPKTNVREGRYIGDVKYRKIISKRLRSLGLTETKTYTLISEEMSHTFSYENKQNVVLPNPMSLDKSVVRTSLLPSIYQVYQYNKSRKVKDIFLYEISKTYDKEYQEESKICGLLSGTYMTNGWTEGVSVDFYLVKGILENLLDYMGFKNRYSFERSEATDFHPGMCASILLDRKPIGILGRIHPKTNKEDVYMFEISMNALMSKTKLLKYKEVSKYPSVHKDVAFIMPRNMPSKQIEMVIGKIGGRLLMDIQVFDIYEGDKIGKDEKSIAYALTFNGQNRTLEEKEVTEIFYKIIDGVKEKCNVKLRDK